MGILKLACIVGARPNFMKMAPLLRAIEAYPQIRPVLIHTGQHYDPALSNVFFEDLGMRRPDICLEVGSASHAVQTARVLERMEEVLSKGEPDGTPYDMVVVVGNVNSTMAAALAAVKLEIPVAHVEAGLRSDDRSMPEEINRIVTDSIAETLLVSEPAGMANLRREGHPEQHLHLVGNVMIDTLLRLLPKARAMDAPSRYGLRPGQYGVITLHRPSNVDQPQTLSALLGVIAEASAEVPLAFAIHPRTRRRIAEFGLDGLLDAAKGVVQLPPLGYLDFLSLSSQSRLIITDSGGLQEESTALGIPCLTARFNTERPITVEEGTSTLVGNRPDVLRKHLRLILDGGYKQGRCPALWDGRTAERIAKILASNGRAP